MIGPPRPAPAGLLVAVDPGIDIAAAAIYDLSRVGRPLPVGSLDAAARGFVRVVRGRTDTRATTLERCTALFEWLRALALELDPVLVVIEVPAHAGTYRGKLHRQEGAGSLNAAALEKLNRAIGALCAGAHAGCAANPEAVVVEFRSDYGKGFNRKRVRHDALAAAFRLAGLPVVGGNEDDRDAAFLGAFYIATQLPRGRVRGAAGT
ncbi:MAG TPA: hypothetical protein VFR37_08535 [Longimicrobium sp.]|nr:hypothetical protein [Longimicrobium sp.]